MQHPQLANTDSYTLATPTCVLTLALSSLQNRGVFAMGEQPCLSHPAVNTCGLGQGKRRLHIPRTDTTFSLVLPLAQLGRRVMKSRNPGNH